MNGMIVSSTATSSRLTSEQIEAMPAGEEMDILVAERITGWTPANDGSRTWRGPGWTPERPTPERWPGPPSASTDIAAAWAVVEALNGRGLRVDIALRSDGVAFVEIGGDEVIPCCVFGFAPCGMRHETETVQAQICRAGLLATLVEP